MSALNIRNSTFLTHRLSARLRSGRSLLQATRPASHLFGTTPVSLIKSAHLHRQSYQVQGFPDMAHSTPSKETPSHFTYNQISHFVELTSQIHGATIRFSNPDNNATKEEITPQPTGISPLQMLQRLVEEAQNPTESSRNGATLQIQVAGMDIQLTKSHEEAPRDVTFSPMIKPSHEIASESQRPADLQKPCEYRVFSDYQTSFVWAVSSDGLQDEVSDEEFPLLFNPGLADGLIKWSQTYDTSFVLRECDQGSGCEVFPTVGETMTWVIEGAILAAHIAAVAAVPVVYSAYLPQGSECGFVGDPAKDGATLLALVAHLHEHPDLIYTADS